MAMRLGKTLVAIRWLAARQPRLVLIVAPLSTLLPWQDELIKEAIPRRWDVRLLTGSGLHRLALAEQPGPAWCLVNYEGLRSCPALTWLDWDAVVLDESTRIKNPKAAVTKLCLRQLQHVPNRAILSGLPAPEGPKDLFTQMRFLYDPWMGCDTYWQWQHRYFRLAGFDWVPKRGALAAIKERVQTDAVVLSRKQAGIGERKVFERRIVRLTSEQRALITKVKREFAVDEQMQTKWNVTRLTWLLRLAGGCRPDGAVCSWGKVTELHSLLMGELREEQVLVWFHFNREIEMVTGYLGGRVPIRVIQGSTPPAQRHSAIKDFQSGKVRVLLLQSAVGLFGIDLSAADTAIYYSNALSTEIRYQSEDRIIHPKKKTALLYVDLVTEGSADQRVLDLLRTKRAISKQLMTRMLLQELKGGHAC